MGVERLRGEELGTTSIDNPFAFYCKGAVLEGDVGARHCFLKMGEVTVCSMRMRMTG